MSDPAPRDDDPMRRVTVGGSVHDAFHRDVLRLLETVEMSDEDRQRILTNMVCPCCGGAASLVVPLTGERAKD